MIVLDVGTRSIICIEHEGNKVTRVLYREHAFPCMKEGNVYDLTKALESISAVRKDMALPEGTEVAVAIAGGQLTTRKISVSLSGNGPWSESDIENAEKNLIKKIQSGKRSKKILLGVQRTAFKVDGKQVGSVAGLFGKKAEYQSIMTFLPIENIKTKLGVIEKAGFKPISIAVEPLAVERAIFGKNLPPSPFALIDIGAGTSDIAVVSSSGLHGVASIPLAGDTITESISKNLGLDYLSAEKIKRNYEEEIVDIWGEKKKFSLLEVNSAAEDGLKKLVSAISDKLTNLIEKNKLNGIVLVGGGSLWRDLPERLAYSCDLSKERVRIRVAESITEIEDTSGQLKGPVYLTAIGILLSRFDSFVPIYYSLDGVAHFSVEMPGKNITVAETLLSDSRDPLDEFGEPGRAIIVDGKIIAGGPGGEPEIKMNNKPVSLDDSIFQGADIKIEKGEKGRDAKSEEELSVILDGKEYSLTTDNLDSYSPDKIINFLKSKINTVGTYIVDGKEIQVGERFKIIEKEKGKYYTEELPPLKLEEIIGLPQKRSIKVHLNGVEKEVTEKTISAVVNGKREKKVNRISWGSQIITERDSWRVYEALDEIKELPKKIKINDNEGNLSSEINAECEVNLA